MGGGAGLGTWITLTSSPGSSEGGSGILGRGAAQPREVVGFCSIGLFPSLIFLVGLFRLAKLGAEVTVGKKDEAVIVIGLGIAEEPPAVERCRNSGRSVLSNICFSVEEFFSGDFLEELIVDLPESFELNVEEGKSTLVSRNPVQIYRK